MNGNKLEFGVRVYAHFANKYKKDGIIGHNWHRIVQNRLRGWWNNKRFTKVQLENRILRVRHLKCVRAWFESIIAEIKEKKFSSAHSIEE